MESQDIKKVIMEIRAGTGRPSLTCLLAGQEFRRASPIV